MVDVYGTNQISLKIYILDLNVMLICVTSIFSSIIAVTQLDLYSMNTIFHIFLRVVFHCNITLRIVLEVY
jgi:hypothetical protein